MDMLEKETRAIVDRALEMGDGDPVVGADQGNRSRYPRSSRCIEPVCQWCRNGCKRCQRVPSGISFVITSPSQKRFATFIQDKLAEREKTIGKKLNWDMVVEDILQISQPLA